MKSDFEHTGCVLRCASVVSVTVEGGGSTIGTRRTAHATTASRLAHKQVCGTGEDPATILLCDGCEGECHMRCATPRLTAAPHGDWFCRRCCARKPRHKIAANLTLAGVGKRGREQLSLFLSFSPSLARAHTHKHTHPHKCTHTQNEMHASESSGEDEEELVEEIVEEIVEDVLEVAPLPSVVDSWRGAIPGAPEREVGEVVQR